MAKKPVVKATKDAVKDSAEGVVEKVESDVVDVKSEVVEKIDEKASEVIADDVPRQAKSKSSFSSKALGAIALLLFGERSNRNVGIRFGCAFERVGKCQGT